MKKCYVCRKRLDDVNHNWEVCQNVLEQKAEIDLLKRKVKMLEEQLNKLSTNVLFR